MEITIQIIDTMLCDIYLMFLQRRRELRIEPPRAIVTNGHCNRIGCRHFPESEYTLIATDTLNDNN